MNTTQTAHTPTQKYTTSYDGVNYRLSDHDGLVALVPDSDDADFLRVACNAHDALVAALESINHMGGDERGGYCICHLMDGSAPAHQHASGCADVRAALALAKGESC